ncbi:MAG: ATP-binding cassette domain-containing protein [Clostridiales bacterium]|nr:ATP-binding cassette domain-containing protein [Clostridiales bacterium]
MIKIENLKKTYRTTTSVEALRGISTEIEDGDIFGIIGLSGAGKSTLLRCIALLETPTEGRILIDGKDISSLRGRELTQHRGQIGVIFQGYNLLMQRTVAGNVAFPLEIAGVPKQEIHRRVEELLELVDLADKADSYPSQLSGGQCQRVAIARALANNPRVLLCDEPTSALDSFTTKSILDLLRDINQKLGVTIIIITHEIGVVKQICNRVAVIESGLFAEHGTAAEVLAAPKSMAAKQLIGIGGAL